MEIENASVEENIEPDDYFIEEINDVGNENHDDLTFLVNKFTFSLTTYNSFIK